MKETIVVTTLVENSVPVCGLLAEHGLAFHIQAGPRSLLFDTSQSDLLLHNALKLRISLADAEAIVLSHGHNDHTGGLKAAHEAAPQARLFLNRAALSPKFARNPDGTSRSIGMDEASAETIRRAAKAVVWTRQPTEVLDGIFVTGEIPRPNTFEDPGGPFFRDADSAQPDPLADDQALFFDTQEGLVVLLGCGHAGVVNMLEYVLRHLTRRQADSRNPGRAAPAEGQPRPHGEDHCRVSPVGYSTTGPGALHRYARAGPVVDRFSGALLLMRGGRKPSFPKIESKLMVGTVCPEAPWRCHGDTPVYPRCGSRNHLWLQHLHSVFLRKCLRFRHLTAAA
jgi:7,8-dihydropterin-6-yl-methyl-4-(beta-D-ribofuranosyl)aminobenzene 5'-phosphate synthase